jgi:thiol-disulfide isomerase/thioredoxin
MPPSTPDPSSSSPASTPSGSGPRVGSGGAPAEPGRHPTPAAAAATGLPQPAGAELGRRERMLLAAIAALLALLLLWLRGGLHPEAPLERLARQSPELSLALGDGHPTVVEFYADWCEACRAMAPAMDRLEQQHRGALDVVLLNVDNPRWQAELERYDVNGIPQLELFDGQGIAVGRSIGARSAAELESLLAALLADQPLPALPGVGATSALPAADQAAGSAGGSGIGPRSHG